MGGHRRDVCSCVGGRGRHRALRCHGVAVRTRRRVRAVPDLQQRTLALRTAPRSHRTRLPSRIRRPYARSKDAGIGSRGASWFIARPARLTVRVSRIRGRRERPFRPRPGPVSGAMSSVVPGSRMKISAAGQRADHLDQPRPGHGGGGRRPGALRVRPPDLLRHDRDDGVAVRGGGGASQPAFSRREATKSPRRSASSPSPTVTS